MKNCFLIIISFLFCGQLYTMNASLEKFKSKFLTQNQNISTTEWNTIIKAILQSGIDIDNLLYKEKDGNYSPLQLAHKNNSWSATYMLIEAGANSSSVKNLKSWNFIQKYSRFNYENLSVEQLIEQSLFAQTTINLKKPFMSSIADLNIEIENLSKETESLDNYTYSCNYGINSFKKARLKSTRNIFFLTLITALGRDILQSQTTLKTYYKGLINAEAEFFNDVKQLLNLERTCNDNYKLSSNMLLDIKNSFTDFKTGVSQCMPEVLMWRIAQKYEDDFL